MGLRDDDSHQVELRLVFFVARGVHDVAVRALAGFVLLGAEKIKRSGFRLVSRLKVRHEHLDLRLEVFDLLVVRVRVRDTLLVRGDRVRRGLLGFRELVIQLRDGLIGLDESQVQFVLAFLRLLKLVKHVLVLVLEIGDDFVVVRAREVVRRTAVPDSEERVARRDDLRVKRRDIFLQRKVFVRQILHLLYQVGDLFRGEAFEGGRRLGGVLVAEMRAVRRTRGGHGPHGGIVGNAERRASRRRRVRRGGRRHDEHGADARGDDAVLHPARRRAGIAGFAEHQRRGLIRGRSACRHRERRSVVLERISYVRRRGVTNDDRSFDRSIERRSPTRHRRHVDEGKSPRTGRVAFCFAGSRAVRTRGRNKTDALCVCVYEKVRRSSAANRTTRHAKRRRGHASADGACRVLFAGSGAVRTRGRNNTDALSRERLCLFVTGC